MTNDNTVNFDQHNKILPSSRYLFYTKAKPALQNGSRKYVNIFFNTMFPVKAFTAEKTIRTNQSDFGKR